VHDSTPLYYFAKHLPMVVSKPGAAAKTTSVDQGVAGPTSGICDDGVLHI